MKRGDLNRSREYIYKYIYVCTVCVCLFVLVCSSILFGICRKMKNIMYGNWESFNPMRYSKTKKYKNVPLFPQDVVHYWVKQWTTNTLLFFECHHSCVRANELATSARSNKLVGLFQILKKRNNFYQPRFASLSISFIFFSVENNF